MCYYSRNPSRTGSRTSFLLLGRLSIGTVTCRQFSGRPRANQGAPDIRSTENPPYSQRQPHASQLSCHSFLIIHEVILNCKNYFCIYLQTFLVNFTILQFVNCRVEHFYFTGFLQIFQQGGGGIARVSHDIPCLHSGFKGRKYLDNKRRDGAIVPSLLYIS